jgi:hypothetical protein
VDAAARLTTSREAVALVEKDWSRQGGSQQRVTVWLNADDEVCIWVNGGGTTPSADGGTRVDLVVSVADYLQTELMEVDSYRVWPLSDEHRVGLHARAQAAEGAWWCQAGQHVVATIGSLPTP